jgi:hypothetical protein
MEPANLPGPNQPGGGTLDRGVHTSVACTYVVLPVQEFWADRSLLICIHILPSLSFSTPHSHTAITRTTSSLSQHFLPSTVFQSSSGQFLYINILIFILIYFFCCTATSEPFSQEEKSQPAPLTPSLHPPAILNSKSLVPAKTAPASCAITHRSNSDADTFDIQ